MSRIHNNNSNNSKRASSSRLLHFTSASNNVLVVHCPGKWVSLEQVYSNLLALLEEAEHSQPRPLAERVAVMTANNR
jgi:hypothetical protein